MHHSLLTLLAIIFLGGGTKMIIEELHDWPTWDFQWWGVIVFVFAVLLQAIHHHCKATIKHS